MSARVQLDEGVGTAAVPSTAAVNGHPVHPVLVAFPIAFLSAALVTDIAFLATDQPFWALGSFWLLVAGIVMGVIAAIFGMIDFFGDSRVKSLTVARLHFGGNAFVLALAGWNCALRMSDPLEPIASTGIVLSAAAVLLLMGTGWLGGELAYRYRVGVMAGGAVRRR